MEFIMPSGPADGHGGEAGGGTEGERPTRAGGVGLVKRNCGRYVENTGDDDLVWAR
jgi:oxalate decarboxylase/phosphoglucose isomerase-like protein (cupin superfamily)